MMQARVLREQQFHNQSYTDGRRTCLSRVYQVRNNCVAYYKGLATSHCSKGISALEYGCGRGSLAFAMAEKGADVIGIDISEVAINQAEHLAASKGSTNLSFRVMDAEHLNYEPDTFDVICGSSILHHLDLHRSLAELARVVKPTGRAIFIEPLGHNPLLNLFRKLTPNLRTPDEHPLLVTDLKTVSQYFAKVETRYFCLWSLIAIPLLKLPGSQFLLSLLEAVDRVSFRLVRPLRKYAWTVVIVMSQPKS